MKLSKLFGSFIFFSYICIRKEQQKQNNMESIENFKKRIAIGNSFMKMLSTTNIKDIIAVIEKIWENTYSNLPYSRNLDDLKNEYSNRKISVVYNSNLEVEKIKISWNYWDSVDIELSAYGLTATFKPEHGSHKELLNMNWVLLEKFFEDCFQN